MYFNLTIFLADAYCQLNLLVEVHLTVRFGGSGPYSFGENASCIISKVILYFLVASDYYQLYFLVEAVFTADFGGDVLYGRFWWRRSLRQILVETVFTADFCGDGLYSRFQWWRSLLLVLLVKVPFIDRIL